MDDGNPPAEGAVPPSRFPLGKAHRGFRGRVDAIEVTAEIGGLRHRSLNAACWSLGLSRASMSRILREGPFGRDPIAVRVGGSTVALRRNVGMAIYVTDEKA